MSSSLSVYALDLASVRGWVGSHDSELLAAVRAEFRADLARDDDYHRLAIGQGAPTADEALRAVVDGGPFSERREHAFQYGYAYRRLCEFAGTPLPNDCFTPHRGGWLTEVDQALGACGVTAVSLAPFDTGAPPPPLPYPYTPGCAQWTPDAIARALGEFVPADLEPPLAEAVDQCVGWLRQTVGRPGAGVVGFRS